MSASAITVEKTTTEIAKAFPGDESSRRRLPPHRARQGHARVRLHPRHPARDRSPERRRQVHVLRDQVGSRPPLGHRRDAQGREGSREEGGAAKGRADDDAGRSSTRPSPPRTTATRSPTRSALPGVRAAQGWDVVEPPESDENKSAFSGSRGTGLVRAKERAAAAPDGSVLLASPRPVRPRRRGRCYAPRRARHRRAQAWLPRRVRERAPGWRDGPGLRCVVRGAGARRLEGEVRAHEAGCGRVRSRWPGERWAASVRVREG